MARTVNTSIPNPDDATNGLADQRLSVSFYRTEPGGPVRVRVDYALDPDGAWEVTLATALPLAADRTALRDVINKVLATFKTARGYV